MNNNGLSSENLQTSHKKVPKKLLIAIGIGILTIVLILILVLSNKNSISTPTKNSSNQSLQFKINNNEYVLGDKVKKFLDNGFSIVKYSEKLSSGSIMISPFYIDNKTYFQAVLYCTLDTTCDYEEANVIKINFYKDSEVLINDKISFESDKSSVEELFKKPEGHFYLDNDMHMWSFGTKVGNNYLGIKFDDQWILSSGKPQEIRIGMWWYEDEYQSTIIKDEA